MMDIVSMRAFVGRESYLASLQQDIQQYSVTLISFSFPILPYMASYI